MVRHRKKPQFKKCPFIFIYAPICLKKWSLRLLYIIVKYYICMHLASYTGNPSRIYLPCFLIFSKAASKAWSFSFSTDNSCLKTVVSFSNRLISDWKKIYSHLIQYENKLCTFYTINTSAFHLTNIFNLLCTWPMYSLLSYIFA